MKKSHIVLLCVVLTTSLFSQNLSFSTTDSTLKLTHQTLQL
jgi:hypothetical protein